MTRCALLTSEPALNVVVTVRNDAKAAEHAKTVLHLEKGVLLEREGVKAGGGIGGMSGVGGTR